MNPEAKFRKYPPDYSNMRVEEVVFARICDCYGEVKEYTLDLLRPIEQKELLPVICFIHGGGLIQPNDRKQSYISYFAQKLLADGYAVVAPDYPVYNTENDRNKAGDEYAQTLPAVSAVHEAHRFIVENGEEYGLNPENMVLMGGSAGGWVSFAATEMYPEDFSVLINLWGAPERIPDVKRFPPVFSVHGTEDLLVPYEREHALHRELERMSVVNQLYTIEGAGHTPIMQMEEYLPEILEFIQRCRNNIVF